MSRTSKLMIGVGAAVALVLGGTVAWAQIPSADGTIRACYDTGGNVKLIDEGKSCPKGWKGPISWNQQGQPGADGTDGVSGYERVEATDLHEITDAITPSFVEIVSCPPGKVVVGGGGVVGLGAALGASSPIGDSTWQIVARPVHGVVFPEGESVFFRVFAICVTAN